jgi:hypothetical protein
MQKIAMFTSKRSISSSTGKPAILFSLDTMSAGFPELFTKSLPTYLHSFGRIAQFTSHANNIVTKINKLINYRREKNIPQLLFLRVIKLEKKQYILFAPFRRKQVSFLQLRGSKM